MTTFFDLFAGIGGFRLALERLGWRCAGGCENDRYCNQTYNANFATEGDWFWEDAAALPAREMPDFDVLCAGFPCQSFSMAGHRRGFEDARGTLIYEIFRVLEAKKPKAFLLENVKGLTFRSFEKEFSFILKALHGLGYRVSWKVLNSKDFGVPQNRERVFFAGFRGGGSLDREFVFPKGRPLTVRLRDVLEEEVDPKYNLSEKLVKCLMRHLERHRAKGHGFGMRILGETSHTGKLVDKEGISSTVHAHRTNNVPHILVSSLVGGGQGRERNLVANTPSARYGKDGSENLIQRKIRIHRNDKKKSEIQGYSAFTTDSYVDIIDGHAKNILIGETAHTKGNMKNRLREGDVMWNLDGANSKAVGVLNATNPHNTTEERRFHPSETVRTLKPLTGFQQESIVYPHLRRLTPRECARLQGFPDSFKIPVSDTQAYREFGNAITIPVVEAIGRRMEKFMGCV